MTQEASDEVVFDFPAGGGSAKHGLPSPDASPPNFLDSAFSLDMILAGGQALEDMVDVVHRLATVGRSKTDILTSRIHPSLKAFLLLPGMTALCAWIYSQTPTPEAMFERVVRDARHVAADPDLHQTFNRARGEVAGVISGATSTLVRSEAATDASSSRDPPNPETEVRAFAGSKFSDF